MQKAILIALFIAAAGTLGTICGCATAPRTEERRAQLAEDVQASLAKARAADPTLGEFLDEAHGYAVFPTVGKGAAGVGGAYGRGQVFEQGNLIGYCDLSQATIGLQLGGQAYTQIIAFEHEAALNRFKTGQLAFAAQATAVALKSGAGANARFADGVAVFTMDEAGLMYEASIGGQSFSFQPID